MASGRALLAVGVMLISGAPLEAQPNAFYPPNTEMVTSLLSRVDELEAKLATLQV